MKRFSILGAVLLVAACSTNTEPLGADFGNAVRQNKAAHIINPAPTYDRAAETDGDRMALGIQLYKQGEVKQPVGERTSQTGGGK